jgi:peptidoglycan hydrolase-like protein with peptidoglycan-binding domain
LQPTAGNAAVAQLLADRRPLVQRAPTETDPPALVSPELAGSPRCQEAYSNRAKPLFEGETSEGVGTLQAALTQIGFGSGFQKTQKKGHADQAYGPETRKAVRDFQTRHNVRPVGGSQAGHKTLLALDRALGAHGSTVPGPSAGSIVSLPKNIQTGEKPGSVEKNGTVVQKPETAAATTQTEDKDDDPKEVAGKLSITVAGQQNWNSTDPPDAPNATKSFFCDHGVMQMSGQILIPWERNQGRKLKLLPEFDIQVDFAPATCNKQPTVGVQANAAKLQISKAVELAANAALQLQGPPTGWVLQGSIELDLHPFKDGLFKNAEVDVTIQGGGLFIPQQEGVNEFKVIGQGGLQLGLKYTF